MEENFAERFIEAVSKNNLEICSNIICELRHKKISLDEYLIFCKVAYTKIDLNHNSVYEQAVLQTMLLSCHEHYRLLASDHDRNTATQFDLDLLLLMCRYNLADMACNYIRNIAQCLDGQFSLSEFAEKFWELAKKQNIYHKRLKLFNQIERQIDYLQAGNKSGQARVFF